MFPDLSVITGAIVEMNLEAISKNLMRREAVIRTLQRLKLKVEPPADDFEGMYAYTLVEYGIFKPEPILKFFRNEFVRNAFRKAFYDRDWDLLAKEAEGIIEWNRETKALGDIDYDPRREFATFGAVFHQIVDNSRTPVEVKQSQKLEDVYLKVEMILERLEGLNALGEIRTELAKLLSNDQPTSPAMIHSPILMTTSQPQHTMIQPNVIRWLHLSDFHVGKDGYGQQRLFTYLLTHIRQRIQEGLIPDFVFITGDIANKGKESEYQDFNDGFLFPLIELLPAEISERIFMIPGNHDVNRLEARVAQTYDVLLRVPEFLDPDERGLFERRQILSRFRAFMDKDVTQSVPHWLESPKGVYTWKENCKGLRIGLLAINTAWLSYSDNDRNRLVIGKGLLEVGLETLQDCDFKIVLGHHPLDWFVDSESEATQALLGRHNVLYLHGHMHEGRAGYLEGAGYPFLALQSGACFQARENDLWVNRFLWSEFNPVTRDITVEPLQWNRRNQEWVLDGTAFPERFRSGDRWLLPFPQQNPVRNLVTDSATPTAATIIPPAGWILIDAKALHDRAKERSSDQILSFFDGRNPTWGDALSPRIPRRESVYTLAKELEAARQAEELRVTLLTGAAGEGKTTLLMQAICELVTHNHQWQVLWRYEPEAPLPAEWIAKLPNEGTWLIASDDAEVIALRTYQTVQALRSNERRNIQFLLCCRDTDWKAVEADKLAWKQSATFVEKQLRGLTIEDAKCVVEAWSRFGEEGLKELRDLTTEEASAALVESAKSVAESDHEGTFFGAILQVRWGAELRDHIADLLDKLESRRLSSGKTLLDAFAYIAAMHAENLPLLSREVLAEVLHIELRQLKKAVLRPLGEEAAIATTGKLIFSRHRAIAKVALEILDESSIDVENLYIDLAQAAQRIFVRGDFVPDIGKWKFDVTTHFFDKGNRPLGIRLAKGILETRPTDQYLIVKVSQLFRKLGQPESGIQNFLTIKPKITKVLRGFYHEWGLAECHTNQNGKGIWLIAFSLSDEAAIRPPENEDGKLSLTALSRYFGELYEQFNDLTFMEACGAAVQLGFRLHLDAQARGLLRKDQERVRTANVVEVTPQEALARLQAGVQMAWAHREDDLPEWIVAPSKLHFQGLIRLLRITT